MTERSPLPFDNAKANVLVLDDYKIITQYTRQLSFVPLSKKEKRKIFIETLYLLLFAYYIGR